MRCYWQLSTLLVAFIVACCGQVLPDDFQRGMTFAGGRWCPTVRYTSSLSDRSLHDLQNTTSTEWVAVLVTRFALTINTTDIFSVPLGTNTDHELEYVIKKAHSLNMKVMLKLHIDNIVQFGGVWRGDIGMYFTPQEWQTWFDNYKSFARHYAILAERAGVEQMAIGCANIQADLQEQHWREVIAEVRKVYKGTLTYACNFWGDNVYGSRFSCMNVTWWDALDIIGVDAYYPIAPDNPYPTLDELKASWPPIAKSLKQLSDKYQKHLIFTEIGYPSQNSANIKPNKWDVNVPTNYTLQKECYRAFFEEMALKHSDWFKGVYWWAWWTDPLAGLDYTNLYTPQNKPVLNVLKEYYSKTKQACEEKMDIPALTIDDKYHWCGVPQSG